MAQTDWGWQGKCTTLVQRMAYILGNNVVPSEQVVFRCGVNATEDILAHKLLLACGSEPFCAMFYGTAADLSAVIRVTDVEPAPFRNLLRYFYLDNVDGITADNALATLYGAKKYGVPALMAICRQKAEQTISHQNACDILVQARNWDEQKLGDLALAIIDRQTALVLNSNSFLKIDHQILCDIVKRQTLTVREVELYSAVRRWAEKRNHPHEKSGKAARELLGSVINEIKFPLMTMEELSDGPIQDGILTPEEVKDIVLYLHAQKKPVIKFGSNPRKPAPGQEQVALRSASICDPKTDPYFQQYGHYQNRFGGYHYQNNIGSQQFIESFQFVADQDITLFGCGLFGSCATKADANSDHQRHQHHRTTNRNAKTDPQPPQFQGIAGVATNVVVPDARSHSATFTLQSENRVEITHTAKFCSDGTKSLVRFMFPKQVAIQAKRAYTITAVGPENGPTIYYGTVDSTKVVQLSGSVPGTSNTKCTVTFSNPSTNRLTPEEIMMHQIAGLICTWP